MADRESMELVRDEVWVDVKRFRGLLAECRNHGHAESEVCARCLARLSEAVALYRDDFLAGFALCEGAAFDDWQFFQGEELRSLLAGALERLGFGLGAREEWEEAIRHAGRWLALDPLHEPAHRWLMRLYAWAGQRAAALRQYRECVRILEGNSAPPHLKRPPGSTRPSRRIACRRHRSSPAILLPGGKRRS